MRKSHEPVVPTARGDAPATPREWILAAVLFGMVVIDGLREGGFWHTDALVTAVASVAVLMVAVVVNPLDRRAGAVVVCATLLAAWWAIRAAGTGSISAFLPLGASFLAFAAAFAAVRPLRATTRQFAALAVAVLGAAGATVGFLGLIWRWFPSAAYVVRKVPLAINSRTRLNAKVEPDLRIPRTATPSQILLNCPMAAPGRLAHPPMCW